MPVAWLLQNLLSLGRVPLRPRTVLLVGIVFAIAGVSVAIARLCARSRPAKLITISNGKITRLGSLVSGRGWSLPVIDITTRTTDLGFVKQVRLSGRRKRTTYPRHYFRPKLNLIVSLVPCRRADMKSSQKKTERRDEWKPPIMRLLYLELFGMALGSCQSTTPLSLQTI